MPLAQKLDYPADQQARAYHPESGSVLVGQVISRNNSGDVEMIPDGLQESVVIRKGVWMITQ